MEKSITVDFANSDRNYKAMKNDDDGDVVVVGGDDAGCSDYDNGHFSGDLTDEKVEEEVAEVIAKVVECSLHHRQWHCFFVVVLELQMVAL